MILDYLNQHIISQDIALAMYYHSLKSKFSTNKKIGTNGSVMIVGPTGSGKTFIVQKVCEYIDTVSIHVDAASMLPEGIQGYSIANLGKDILSKSNYNIHRASHCVVFLDEMDKLFNGDDASEYGLRVASQLLRLIEGTKIKLSNDIVEKHLFNKTDELNTINIQFILGGAFQWIIDEKSERKSAVGFTNVQNEILNSEITLEDLYKENIPKELLERMSTIVNLKQLTQNDYFNILTNSKSSPLIEFVNKIEFHGDQVEIDDVALQNISVAAAKSKLGVRSIKQILKSIFHDALFSAADGEYKTHTITFNSIEDTY